MPVVAANGLKTPQTQQHPPRCLDHRTEFLQSHWTPATAQRRTIHGARTDIAAARSTALSHGQRADPEVPELPDHVPPRDPRGLRDARAPGGGGRGPAPEESRRRGFRTAWAFGTCAIALPFLVFIE